MKAITLNTNPNGRATLIKRPIRLLSLCFSVIASLVFAGNFAFAQAQSTPRLLKGNDTLSNDIKEMLNSYSQKIYFTENKGQWPGHILYKADFPLGQAIATKDGMLVGTFAPADVDADHNWSIREEESIRRGAKIKEPEPAVKGHGWLMNFVNHSPDMKIETQDKHKDVFNYFYGTSSQTGVNNYQEVWYKNVYKNVDVRYYPSKTGTLEYDIVCKPGFNKNEVAIQLTGIDKITVGKDGHLVFKTSVGDMDFPAPVAYQKGIGKKQVPVKVQYYITDNNVLHFTLGNFDESKALIIDPIALRWATWMTNNSAAADHGHCIWIDPSDNGIYVVSRFAGAGLITVNAFQANFAGGSSYDLCIGKYYEPSAVGGTGTRVWQTYLGGTGEDNPYSILQGLDSAIYITGYTSSTNFPMIGGTQFGTSANGVNDGGQSTENIFVTKIWKDGQSIKTAIVGGNGDDYSYDMGLDSYGDITICGYTSSTNLATLFPATQASNTNNGGADVLVFQITSNFETINWMRNYGGKGRDVATILQQNPVTNEIYIAGNTQSTNFPVSSGARQSSLKGSGDGFIQKLSSTGSTIWSSYFNSASGDSTDILCMNFNTSDNAFFFGGLTTGLGTNNTPSGTYQTSIGGGQDFFCAVMDTNQTFVASTYIGGSGNEVNMMGLNVDLNNDVYLFGYTPSTNFPVTSDALQSTNYGDDDKVFFKLNTGLTSLMYSTYYGGTDDDYDPVGERGIKFSNCHIYTIVTAESPNIPLTQGAITTHKLSSTSIYEPGIVEWSNPPDMIGNSLSGNQSLCYGEIPTNITGSAPTYSLPHIVRYTSTGSSADSTSVTYPVTYTTNSTYQWQESTDSINWTNITGGTTQNLLGSLIGAVYKTTFLRRLIGGDACVVAPAASQIITINVLTVTADVNNGCYNQNNGSITITSSTGTAPYTYSWSNGSTAQTRTGLSAGTYYVTVTDHAGCSASGSFAITNPTQITATATSTTTPNCESIATASVTVSGGTSPYTYSWSNGDIQPNIFNLPAGTYTVTVTDADGCTPTSSTTISGKAPPPIAVNSPSICSGSSVTLTATGASSYTWTPGTNLSATTGASVTANPTTTTTYNVTGTASNGCTASAMSTVVVNHGATCSASGGTTVCAGSPCTLTASCSGSGTETSGINYTWSPTYCLNQSTGASCVASPTATTTFTVVGTNSSGCTGSASVVVTCTPLPVVNVSVTSGNASYCTSGSATLTATGATTYTWAPNVALTGTTGASVTANPTVTTTYTVTGTTGNCYNTATIVITVNIPVQVAVTSPTTCKNIPVNITASGVTSYIWTPTTDLNQTTGAVVTAVNPTVSNSYTVTGTDANGCTSTAVSALTVNTPVQVTVSSPTTCKNIPVNITASGVTSYIWTPTTDLNQTTGAVVTAVNPTVSNSYTVTGTDANGCTSTAVSALTVNTPVQVTVSSPTTCKNIPVNITASGVTSYVWTPSTDLNQTTGATVSAVNPTVTTSYTVTGTDANGCTSTAVSALTVNTPVQVTVSSPTTCKNIPVNITASGVTSYVWTPSTDLNQTTGATVSAVNPTVTTSYTVTGTDANGCTSAAISKLTVNTPVQVTVSSPTTCKNIPVNITASGESSYTWAPSTGLSATTGATVSVTNPTATTSYTVTGTDGNGCTSTAVSTVTVNSPVQVAVSSPTTCKNIAVNITASGESSYTWSPATGLNKTTGATVSVTNPTATTSYTVTGTDGNGCTSTAVSTVTVNTPVQVAVSSPTTCKNIAVNITASGESSYTWAPSTGLNQTTGATVSVTNPTAITSYTVTGTDGNGCTSTAVSTVTVNTPIQVTVSSPTTCKNIAVNMTASGESSYTWSSSTGLNQTTGATVSVTNPTATTSYTVTGTDGNGCTSTAVSTVTVNTPVQVAVSSPTTCKNIAVNITASGESSYSWTPSTGLSATTGATVSVTNPTATTSYTVTGTDGNGCTSTAVSTVTVNTPVQVTVSSPTTCKNIAVNITASGESSYTWAPSTGLSATTGATVSVTNPTATTSYTVTGTDGNGCTSSAVSTVTVNTPVQVAVSSPTTCKNIAVNITASGESSYSWTPSTGLNQTTGAAVSVTNPTATTSYTVTGTDGNGCTSTAVSTVTVNTPVQVTVSSPTTCKNIAVNITASGESSYSWTPSTGLSATTGATVSVTNPTATTSYTVTGTDGNGCTSTAVSTVTVNTPVQVAVSSPTTCKNIAVNMTASGESSYSWSPSTGLSATTGAIVSVTNPTTTTSYTVTGTDGNGCTSTAVSTVTVNTPVQVAVSSPTTCKNIAVNITASGESSYTWSPSTGLNQTTGATVSVTNPTATTSYTVTGTDGNGCTSTAVSTVTVNTPVQVAVSSPTTCKNIAVNITASGESSYTWSPSTGLNQTTGATVSVTNPTATTSYTVTGTDGNGCTSTAVSTVTVNTPVQVAVSSPTTCKNIAVNITASGESSYTWSPSTGLSATTGATVSVTNPTITTSYTVTGTDGNGCTSTAVSTVTVNTPVQVAVSSPTTCKNIAVNMTASGESSYTWSPSTGLNKTTGATVSVTNPTATTSYTVTGTDGNGCTSTAVSTVTVNPLPSASTGSNQTICLGSTTSIGSSAVSGDTYSWSPASGLNNSAVSNPTASPAAATTYTLTETITATSCTASNTVVVAVNDTPTVTIQGPNTICSYQNANLTLNANAGSGTITSYQWYEGGSQISGATSSTYTATTSGSYSVLITNSNSCTGNSPGFVLNVTSPISIQSSVTEAACNSSKTGYIKLSVSGGTLSYSYSWSNGGGNTDSIGGLIAGNYSVTVYDANLCSATQAFTVTQPKVLALTPHITDVTCYGLSNGAISISPSGGTIPYTYSWNNNSTAQSLSDLIRGRYSVTVTDANGCSSASTDSITQPPPISISAGIQDVSCYGGANGSIDINVTGGTPLHIASIGSGSGAATYIFDWSDGTHDPADTGLTAGIYTVTIMDSHGCSGVDTFTINQPDSMKLMATIIAASCYGSSDGQINISVQGGTTPYTYSWSNDSTTQNINGLTMGSYSVTITDSNGCSLSQSFNLSQPTPITISGATLPVTCNGGDNGLINLTVSGGTSPYTYTWSDGDTRKNVDGLIIGQYSVIVTDANKCIVMDTFQVGQPSTLAFQTIDGAAIPPTCYGFQNGALNISVSGGTTPYTYNWSDGATTQNISGLGAGNYSVTVTDSNKCTISQSTLLSNPPQLVFNVVPDSVVNANCNGNNNGALNISVSGGYPGYSYSWSNGATTQNLSGLVAGSYSVTVDDVFGCSITKTLYVGQPDPLSFSSVADSVINANCYGDRNGAANISISGGITPYTYSWSNGATTQNMSGLGANAYSVTVTDAHHCSISKTLTVGQPNQLTITDAPVTNVSCNGRNDGEVDITISGGTTPYTYSWSNGNLTGHCGGITSGTYNVTVTDAHGCSVTGSYNVSQPNQLSISSALVTDVSCNGRTDGAIDLTISGGTTPYTYSWNNGKTTANNDGIGSGSYNITVTDAHGCSVTGSYNVSQPNQLTISSAPVTNVSCNGGSNGAIDLTISGGTTPYTYSWNNGNTTANNDGIDSGSYSVTVTDAHGCSVIGSHNVSQPKQLTIATAPVTNVSCKGVSNGAVDLTISGGTTPYTYSWSNGNTTANNDGVDSGSYSVTVTDAHGCSVTGSYNVSQPKQLVISNAPVTNVSCNGGSNGAIDLTISGGTTPYTYSWSNGKTTANNDGIGSGSYYVTVTDAHGCSVTGSYNVSQPNQLAISGAPVTNVSCKGGSNGAIDLTISGGTTPYTYSWSNGNTTANNDGIDSGSYSVTVTDSHGCSVTGSYNVSQPNQLAISSAPVTNVSCNGGSNGAVDLTISGGTTPYTYSWNNGNTTANNDGIDSGSYSATVTDVHGCSVTDSYNVSQPSQLAIASAPVTNVSCKGGSNGAIDLTISGGTTPYTYSWSNGNTTANNDGIDSGAYSVTVTDAHGCSVTGSYNVSQPKQLTIASAPVTNTSCNGGSNGAIDLTISGGTTPYTYSWSNGNTTANNDGIDSGSYSVTITDAHGCSVTGLYNVSQPSQLAIAGAPVTNVSCKGGSNGAIDLTISGGTTPYTYSWSNGNTTANNDGIDSGSYSVTVTDAHGCSVTGSYNVSQPSQLAIAGAPVTNVSCKGGSNGAIDLTISGGTTPYTYSWSNGNTTANNDGIDSGSYSVTVTDAHGCSVTGSYNVSQPSQLTISGAPVTNVSCNGGSNGAIDLTISGGTTPYTYSWSNGNTTANNDGVDSGSYSVTVTDAHGCSVTGSYNVSQPNQLAINSAPVTNVSCNGGSNGAVDLTISGGTTPYTYSWSNGNTTDNNDGIDSGSYSVTVTDAHGCSVTGLYNVSQPGQLAIGSPSITEAGCKGIPDGAVNITVSGGTTPYTYSWNNGNTTANNNGIGSGSYNVTVTDAHGCSVTGSYNIPQPSQLAIASAPVTNVSCNGGSNGAIDLTISGGTTPYTYSWSNGNTTANNDGIDSGSYSVTVTDAHGCSVIGSYNVSQPKQLTIATAPVTNVSCKGGSNGAVDLTISGGTTPYTYSWSNGNTTANNDGVDSGSYSVTVTDAHGCSVTGSYNVSQPKQLSIAAAPITNVSCNSGSNGAIDLTISGGTTPYTYSWSNGNTTANNDGIDSGSYSVTVTDAHGCSVTGSYNVSKPKQLSVAAAPITNVSCNSGSNGAVDLTISGGTTPYTYSWSNGKTTANNDAIDSGSYSVTVTDAHGCSVTGSYNVSQPSQLAIAGAPVTNVSCKGGSNGAIDLTISGGTTSYTYSWSNGNTTANNDGIDSGAYSVTVTDAHGCSVTGSYNVSQPSILSVNTSKTDVECSNSCNGTATVTASGGTAPYSIIWNDRDTSFNRTGLCGGNYNFTVTDNNGCTTANSITINQSGSVTVTASKTNLTCNELNGLCDGSISLSVSGGVTPYTIAWSANLYGATGNLMTNLCPDIYSYTVTDANGCSATGSDTITEPSPLLIASNCCPDNISCHNECDGKIIISIYGGVAPFTYSWSGPNGYTSADSNVHGLCPGVYAVTVTDANGCSYDNTHAPLINPDSIISNISGTNPTICKAGSCNGSASVSPSGGTGPYTITWANGSTGTSATGLCSGETTVTITDFYGCTIVDSVNLNECVCPTVTATASNATCYGTCNGSVTLHLQGGAANNVYTVAWSVSNTNLPADTVLNNLCFGTYSYTVTYVNANCTRTGSVNVGQADSIAVTVNKKDIHCSDKCNGSIILAVSGGTAPYTYAWNIGDGYNFDTLTGLCGGTYCYTVTDAMGCTEASCVTIIQTDSIIVKVNKQNETCYGACNGSIGLSVSGGTAPYTYAWDIGDGFNIDTLSGLCAGRYCYTVTDQNGCSRASCVRVSQPDTIHVIANHTNLTCNELNGLCDGTISLAVSGGTTPYTITWGSNLYGATGADMTSLCPDTYCYTVTDANGCSEASCVTIAEPAPLLIASNCCPDDITCYNACNGKINISVYGGTAPFTYSWTGPNGYTSSDSNIYNLCAGVYSVTVTDHNGCSYDNTHAPLINPAPIASNIKGTNASTCDGSVCDGSATVSPSGGTAPYTYEWNLGDGYNYPTVTGLCAGKYYVTITDQLGCSTADSVYISCRSTICDGLQMQISGPTNVCGSNTATLSASPVANATSYSWTGPNGFTASTDTIQVSKSGTYYVDIVYSPSGCHGKDSITVTFNTTPTVTVSQTNISCEAAKNGACDGTISLDISGVNTYTVLWSGPNSFASYSTALTQLCQGTYCYTVSSNGCNVTGCVQITMPPAITFTINSTNVTCSGASNGTAAVVITGEGYSYKWNNGATTASISGLMGGKYCVTVTNASGCTASQCVTIDEPGIVAVTVNTVNASCYGACNGTASATGFGGTAPYSYKWSNEATTAEIKALCAGNYTVTVTATGGCSISKTITISQPAAIDVTVKTTPPSCDGSCNGAACLTISGGVTPYTYSWSNGATTATVSGLCSGTYGVTVTGHGGCTGTSSFTLSPPPPMVATVIVTNVSCGGGACNGAISIPEVTGSISPYTYKWDNGGKTDIMQGLCAGTYEVTITSAVGCTLSKSMTVTQPVPISISVTQTNVTCNGACNGTANVAVEGGTAPYAYYWSNGACTSSVCGLCAGQYTVTVTGCGGCSISKCITITQPVPICVTVNTSTLSCYGSNNSTATLTITGGTAPYTYKWSTGASTATAGGLAAGSYSVTVTSHTGCSVIKCFTISQPQAMVATIKSTNVVCGGNACSGSIAIPEVTGSMAPYTYKWNTGAKTDLLTDLCTNTYDVTVTSATGCTIAKSIVIAPCNENNARTEEGASQTGNGEAADSSDDSNTLNLYPNPFDNKASIDLISSEDMNASLDIFNMSGEKVIQIYNGKMVGGQKYTFTFNAGILPSGMYICRLSSEKGVQSVNVVKVVR